MNLLQWNKQFIIKKKFGGKTEFYSYQILQGLHRAYSKISFDWTFYIVITFNIFSHVIFDMTFNCQFEINMWLCRASILQNLIFHIKLNIFFWITHFFKYMLTLQSLPSCPALPSKCWLSSVWLGISPCFLN